MAVAYLLMTISLQVCCIVALGTPSQGCRLCPPGERVVKTCGTHGDTLCSPCGPGTHSPSSTASETCLPCSLCGDGLFELHPCNATTDVFCELCSWVSSHHSEDFRRKCTQEYGEADHVATERQGRLPPLSSGTAPQAQNNPDRKFPSASTVFKLAHGVHTDTKDRAEHGESRNGGSRTSVRPEQTAQGLQDKARGQGSPALWKDASGSKIKPASDFPSPWYTKDGEAGSWILEDMMQGDQPPVPSDEDRVTDMNIAGMERKLFTEKQPLADETYWQGKATMVGEGSMTSNYDHDRKMTSFDDDGSGSGESPAPEEDILGLVPDTDTDPMAPEDLDNAGEEDEEGEGEEDFYEKEELLPPWGSTNTRPPESAGSDGQVPEGEKGEGQDKNETPAEGGVSSDTNHPDIEDYGTGDNGGNREEVTPGTGSFDPSDDVQVQENSVSDVSVVGIVVTAIVVGVICFLAGFFVVWHYLKRQQEAKEGHEVIYNARYDDKHYESPDSYTEMIIIHDDTRETTPLTPSPLSGSPNKPVPPPVLPTGYHQAAEPAYDERVPLRDAEEPRCSPVVEYPPTRDGVHPVVGAGAATTWGMDETLWEPPSSASMNYGPDEDGMLALASVSPYRGDSPSRYDVNDSMMVSTLPVLAEVSNEALHEEEGGSSRRSAQSPDPTNLDPERAEFDKGLQECRLKFEYFPDCSKTVANTGSTVVVDVDELGSALRGGPLLRDTYCLDHLAFHWNMEEGGEPQHTIQGRTFPGELHFVHWNQDKFHAFQEAARCDDGLAVVAVFIREHDEHAWLRAITESLESIPNKGQSRLLDPGSFDPAALLPDNLRDYWTYRGRYVTNQTSVLVTWIIMREPIEMSPGQMNKFRSLPLADATPGTFRRRRPSKGRTIRSTFSSRESTL